MDYSSIAKRLKPDKALHTWDASDWAEFKQECHTLAYRNHRDSSVWNTAFSGAIEKNLNKATITTTGYTWQDYNALEKYATSIQWKAICHQTEYDVNVLCRCSEKRERLESAHVTFAFLIDE